MNNSSIIDEHVCFISVYSICIVLLSHSDCKFKLTESCELLRLDRVQKERDDLRHQLKIVTDETLTAEEKAQRMDMLLKEEETRIYDVEKQLARLRETQVTF